MIKIGHRGVKGLEPENTLLSFQKAIELNVDMVELDVQMCKTGELVIIHDHTVNRTTDGRGLISKMKFKKLRKLDAGKGEKIPTLEEVLHLIDGKIKINIELKSGNIAKKVANIIENFINNSNWRHQDFIVSSFILSELKEFKKIQPKIKVSPLLITLPHNYLEILEKIDAYSFNLNIKFINENIIKALHETGIKVFVWTIDTLDEIQKMESLGVDGIFLDFSDELLSD